MSADTNQDALAELAEAAGLSTHWIDYLGVHRQVSADTLRVLLAALGYPCASDVAVADSLAAIHAERAQPRLPVMLVARVGEPITTRLAGALPYRLLFEDGASAEGMSFVDARGMACLPAQHEAGYHQLALGDQHCVLAIAPSRCFGLADALGAADPADTRIWGLAAQLYSLRRSGDGGIGDFTALAELACAAAAHGAQALAVSPVHALFAADVERFSPYSPSSRLFVNLLHIDPASVFGVERVAAEIRRLGIADALAALEARELIDWPAAARLRLELLRALHAHWGELPQAEQADYTRFVEQAGPALRDHACFEALHAHFLKATPPCWNWRDWPEAYRDPRSAEVEAFAIEHVAELHFHSMLQWLADRGLRAAQDTARAAGMAIGLIGDLAVGTDGGGSHAWSRQQDLLIGAGVGAPPDALNALGQGWGLTAFSPRALAASGYAPFLEMLRAQLRHAGGLRIDHVLGLGRLWLVPDGRHATEGAYLRYPLDTLFALIALESWRHRAVIIGEDMGTVPADFRPRMDAAGVLGMRVLWFERDWGLFVEPSRWPRNVVSLTTTHDLATVAGWWTGRDIDWRARLQLYGEGQNEADDRAGRADDRTKLWAAFMHAGVAAEPMPASTEPARVVDAALAFVARTPSPLLLIPAEDLLGLVEQPNVPGTIDEHPNWCRRLPLTAGGLLAASHIDARLRWLAAERPASR